MLTNDELSNVGIVIRDALKRLKKSQGWLAEACEVSDQAVSLWIRTGRVSRDKAIVAAQKLQVPVGALIANEDPYAAKIGEAVLSLPKERRENALSYLQYILDSEPEAAPEGYAELMRRIKDDLNSRDRQ